MTPAECEKVIPGCAKVNAYGNAKVWADIKGVAAYEFSFHEVGDEQGLKFATIKFDPRLTDEPFWNALVHHLKGRLPTEMDDFGGHRVLWLWRGQMWSLEEDLDTDGYQLEIAVDE